MQLWPLYLIAAAMGLYTLKGIVVYLWEESIMLAAEAHERNNKDLT
jgi:hypothetical protein